MRPLPATSRDEGSDDALDVGATDRTRVDTIRARIAAAEVPARHERATDRVVHTHLRDPFYHVVDTH